MENKKRSLENGKWKKIVNKHNKKMVALALAGTLMGVQIQGNIELVEASQVSVTSTTTTNSSTFLTAVRRMDNLDAIKQMNVGSLGNISDSVTTARSIYDKLPAEAKSDKGVLRWEGYLTKKEEGIANRFVALSAQLPTNNQMERMSANGLVVARSRINKIRNLYSKLPTNAKMNSGVNRWEGYLTQKEDASGITFVNVARALPSVAEIKEMNEEELLKYYEEAEKVKDAFNALSGTAKSNTQVSTWGTYLATKEDAAYEVAEKLEVELPERAPNDKVEDEEPADEKEPEVPEIPVEPKPVDPVPEIPGNLPLPPAGRDIGYTEKGNIKNDKNVDPNDAYGHLVREKYVIPYETVYIENPLFEEGQEELLLEGVNGTELHVYDVTILGGGAYQRTMVYKGMSQNPINRILVVRQAP